MAQTFLQPICRVLPVTLFMNYGAKILQDVIAKYAYQIIDFGEKFFIPHGGVAIIGTGSLPLWLLRGQPIGRWLFHSYVEEYFCNGPEHLRNYFKFIVECD